MPHVIECSQANLHFNRAQNFKVKAHSLPGKFGKTSSGQQMRIYFLFNLCSHIKITHITPYKPLCFVPPPCLLRL